MISIQGLCARFFPILSVATSMPEHTLREGRSLRHYRWAGVLAGKGMAGQMVMITREIARLAVLRWHETLVEGL